MSAYIDKFRELKPAFKDSTDEELIPYLHEKYASDMPISEFYKKIGVEDPNAPGDISRGYSTGMEQLKQTGYGILAAGGATAEHFLGEGGISTGIKKAGLAGYQEQEAKIAETAKPSDEITYSWEKAKEGDFSALADWMQYGIGQAGSQAVQALATAGLGGFIAKAGVQAVGKELAAKLVESQAAKIAETEATKIAAGELTKEAIEQQATKMVAEKIGNIGATTALGGLAVTQEGGEIGGDLVAKAEKEGRLLTGDELAKAFGYSLGAGALEFVGDKFGLDVLTGKTKFGKTIGGMEGIGGRVARGTVAGLTTAPIEAGTEYGQTLLEEAGKGNDPFSEQARKNAINAAFAGAFGGHVMGMAGGMLTAPIATATNVDDAIVNAEKALNEPTVNEPQKLIPQLVFDKEGNSYDRNELLRNFIAQGNDEASANAYIDKITTPEIKTQPLDLTPYRELQAKNAGILGIKQPTSEADIEAINERLAIQAENNAPLQPFDNSIPFNRQTRAEIADEWEQQDLAKELGKQQALPQDIEARKRLLGIQPVQPVQPIKPIAETKAPIVEPKPIQFTPTHELNDGTPVVKVAGETNVYADVSGNKREADDAVPVVAQKQVPAVESKAVAQEQTIEKPYHHMTLDEYKKSHPKPYRVGNKILKTDLDKMSDDEVLSMFRKADLRLMASVLGSKVSGTTIDILSNIRKGLSNRKKMREMSPELLDGMTIAQLKELNNSLGVSKFGSKQNLIASASNWYKNNLTHSQNIVAVENLKQDILNELNKGAEDIPDFNLSAYADDLIYAVNKGVSPLIYEKLVKYAANKLHVPPFNETAKKVAALRIDAKAEANDFEKKKLLDVADALEKKQANVKYAETKTKIQPVAQDQAPVKKLFNVNGVEIDYNQLTSEQKTAWDEADAEHALSIKHAGQFDTQNRGKLIKASGMTLSAKRREIVGALTAKEQEAQNKKEDVIRSGDIVSHAEFGNGVVKSNPAYGKAKVQFGDNERSVSLNELSKQKESAIEKEIPPETQQLRKGTVGGKLSAGEVVITSSGRQTTPFPKFQTKEGNVKPVHLKAVDKWLMRNAFEEAKARGDEFNARQFENNLDKPSQADKDSAEEYLFGEQPAVEKPILKPLVKDQSKLEIKPAILATSKNSEEITKAQQDVLDALSAIGEAIGQNFRMNITPEQEQKLMPALTRLMDAAFRLGYYKFKDAAKFTLETIRKAFGDELADQINLQHLQGSYIGMSGKYIGQGADSFAQVGEFKSIEQIFKIEGDKNAVEKQETTQPNESRSTQSRVREEGEDTTESGAGIRESGQEEGNISEVTPSGWTKISTGMMTNPDEKIGGVIDTNAVSGKWFFVSNNDKVKGQDNFDTWKDAYDALQLALKKSGIKETANDLVSLFNKLGKQGINKSGESLIKQRSNADIITAVQNHWLDVLADVGYEKESKSDNPNGKVFIQC